MKKKIFWTVVSALIALSLALAGCGQAATPTTSSTSTTSSGTPTTAPTTTPTTTSPTTASPTSEPTQAQPASDKPVYGGQLNVYLGTDITSFDPAVNTGQTVANLLDIVNEPLWEGDWAKGPAGGYGENLIDYTTDNDLWTIKKGIIAESTNWTIDFNNGTGTIVYEIRQGMHFGLNQNNASSKLVNGRELTTEDVIFNMKRIISDPNAYIYRAQTEMRSAEITKTGPWEITVKVPLNAVLTAITRFGQLKIEAPEIVQKFGDQRDAANVVGTGPFILTDYVPSSQVVYKRNPNYWMTNPVGPGKGDQLPYLDTVRTLIIPDASTRMAAFRTGKIDQASFNYDDANTIRSQVPVLKEIQVAGLGAPSTPIRIDTAPFTDVRVRRALFMATDFQSILTNLYPGPDPEIVTWPYPKTPGYEDMFLGLNDPEMPQSVKDLFTYNPDGAKQLLKDAGYPSGIKTTVVTTSGNVDYYSVLKDMWAKAGIDVTINVQDVNTKNNMVTNKTHPALNGGGTGNPIAIWYAATVFSEAPLQNSSEVHDQYINDTINKIRNTILTEGTKPAMAMWKDMMKYVLNQAYVIPGVRNASYRFWWLWVKNYSGEVGMSYYVFNWEQYIWYDQALKKSMGY